MFTFNLKLDRYVLRPVAKGYRKVLPGMLRQGITNFFNNLGEPINIFNDLLQGEFKRAGADVGRLLANTTIGIFGLFDVGTDMGLPRHDQDFGITLGRWGAGEGAYLVLPFFGPSNIRDGFGLVADYYTYPLNYLEDVSTRDELRVTEVVNARTNRLDATEILEQAWGPDPYAFVREAYRQRRKNQVYEGTPPPPPPPDFLFEDADKPVPEEPAPTNTHPQSVSPGDESPNPPGPMR